MIGDPWEFVAGIVVVVVVIGEEDDDVVVVVAIGEKDDDVVVVVATGEKDDDVLVVVSTGEKDDDDIEDSFAVLKDIRHPLVSELLKLSEQGFTPPVIVGNVIVFSSNPDEEGEDPKILGPSFREELQKLEL